MVSMVKDVPPTVTDGDVVVTYDHGGREVVVVPDDLARAMHADVKRTWTEFNGVGYGHSERYRPGHWMYEVTQKLIAVYAGSLVPDALDQRERDQAASDRVWAGGKWPEMYVLIVGRSDWDSAARGWVNYPANPELHVPFSPHTLEDEDGRYISYQG